MGSRRGSAPRRGSSCGDRAVSTQGVGGSGDPAREQLGHVPGLSSNIFGLSPRAARHGDGNARLPRIPLCARSVSSLYHSHRTRCERLIVFSAPSSNLLPQQGPWEDSPGREHLSAAFSMSAIPPSSSSSSFLAACPDPSRGCSRHSPPADPSATHSGTGWTQTKENHGRKCCQSDHSLAPEPAPHAHPAPLQVDSSPWSPHLCFLRGWETALTPYQLPLPHPSPPAASPGQRKPPTAALLSLPR